MPLKDTLASPPPPNRADARDRVKMVLSIQKCPFLSQDQGHIKKQNEAICFSLSTCDAKTKNWIVCVCTPIVKWWETGIGHVTGGVRSINVNSKL